MMEVTCQTNAFLLCDGLLQSELQAWLQKRRSGHAGACCNRETGAAKTSNNVLCTAIA